MTRAGASLLAATLACAGTALAGPAMRRFADRPVAWTEHDDEDVPALPTANHLDGLEVTVALRDGLSNEVDRILRVEGAVPAQDVNAADEVPCSTWFCARNHLRPMTPEAVAAGPGAPPEPPLHVTKGKAEGSAVGFQVADARGRKFLVKLDPGARPGLVTAAEAVGNRLFHAAGYNVPGAFVVDLAPEDLTVDPGATFDLYRVQKRPLGEDRLRAELALTSRLPDGRVRAVAIPWIEGHILGAQDMLGTREGDPNDRIQHEHRRALRASWVLYAWLGVLDPGPINTLDTFVEAGGRHFVRHYLIDFSCAFGSATNYAQGPQQDGEYVIEVGRTLGAFFSLGLYQRPFQARATRDDWQRLDSLHPSIGYFPAEGFDPDAFRTNRKVPPHMRLTDADAYWGAKVVTSFTDAQLGAVVATTRLPPSDAAYLARTLAFRRDVIGRRYLRAVAAVEAPAVGEDGRLCFDDLAIARGYVRADEARYLVDVGTGGGAARATLEQPATGARACVALPAPKAPGAPHDDADDYRVVTVRARLAGGAGHADTLVGKAARVHLAWRAAEQRYAVIGLERDQ
jgi:hypothetical protein